MAAPQPDLDILSNSLIATGQQVSLLSNLPAFNYERFLRDQFNELRQGIAEQFRLLRTELDARFEQVDARLGQMNTRFANLELSTKAE